MTQNNQTDCLFEITSPPHETTMMMNEVTGPYQGFLLNKNEANEADLIDLMSLEEATRNAALMKVVSNTLCGKCPLLKSRACRPVIAVYVDQAIVVIPRPYFLITNISAVIARFDITPLSYSALPATLFPHKY